MSACEFRPNLTVEGEIGLEAVRREQRPDAVPVPGEILALEQRLCGRRHRRQAEQRGEGTEGVAAEVDASSYVDGPRAINRGSGPASSHRAFAGDHRVEQPDAGRRG